MDEGDEHQIELAEATEDAPKAFESAKQTLDFVAGAVLGLLDLPRLEPLPIGRDDRNEAQIQHQPPCHASSDARAIDSS